MIWFNAFLGWQMKRLKNPCIKNRPIRPGSKNLLFFLDVTSKLFQHISELNNLCEEICKVEIDKLAKLQGLFGESWIFKICDKGNISESWQSIETPCIYISSQVQHLPPTITIPSGSKFKPRKQSRFWRWEWLRLLCHCSSLWTVICLYRS